VVGRPAADRHDEIRLRGAHNRANAAAAAAIALARGIEPDAVRVALRTFAGVEHRLEEVATIDGVLYVNDSKATNVDSTLVALASFEQPVHLILGGAARAGLHAPARAGEPLRGRVPDRHRRPLIGEQIGTASSAGTSRPRSSARVPRRSRGTSSCCRPPARATTSSTTTSTAAGSSRSWSGDVEDGPDMPRAAAPAARRKPPRQSAEYNLLLTVTLCLLAAGAVMVYSASSAKTLLQGQGDGTTYLVRYVLYGAIGFGACTCSRGAASRRSRASPAAAGGSFGLLVL
jgi:hypothetical protein